MCSAWGTYLRALRLEPVSPTLAREFDRITRPRALAKEFKANVAGRGARGRDGESWQHFESNLADRCERISASLDSHVFRFSSYKLKLISKGRSSPPREISIPTVRDRLVLRQMFRALIRARPNLEMPLPQAIVKEVVSAIRSGKYETFVRVDVTNFYPSVDHGVLRDQLRRLTRSGDLVDLYLQACSTPTMGIREKAGSVPRSARGLPQGLPVSPPLAELVIQRAESKLRGSSDFHYVRYVDDALVLLPPGVDATVVFEHISSDFRDLKLHVHPIEPGSSKSSIGKVAEGVPYLGYKISPSDTTIREPSVQKLRERLIAGFTRYRRGTKGATIPEKKAAERSLLLRTNLVITGFTLDKRRRGWLPYFSQMTDHGLLVQLDSLVAKMGRESGLSPTFRPVKFAAALRHVSRKKSSVASSVVPDFDTMDEPRIREYLTFLFGYSSRFLAGRSEEQLRELVKKRLRKLARELEADRGETS